MTSSTPTTGTAMAEALVAALAETWRAIQNRHPDVPDVVLTVGSGTLGARRGEVTLGHFAAGRWHTTRSEQGPDAAVDHLRLFGEPWFGGPLPTISDPTYLPVADEIAERTDRPGDETPHGEPWTVRIPTDLVALRTRPGLPTWTKQADGSWLPG
jgi:hypothetical protein